MKIYITTISLFFFYFVAPAQNSFMIKFGSSNDDFPGPVCEVNNNYYYSVSEYIEGHWQSCLYKINPEGEILVKKTFYPNDNYFVIQQLFVEQDSLIIAFSVHSYYLDSNVYLNVICMNSELDIKCVKEHKLQVYELSIKSLIKNNKNKYVLACESFDYNSSAGDPLFININIDGDIVGIQRMYFTGPDFVYDITEKLVDGIPHYLVAYSNIYSSFILELDTSFSLIKHLPAPGETDYYLNIEKINDSNFMFSGKYSFINSYPRNDDIRLMLCDSELQIIKSIFLGAPDTIDYPAAQKNLAKSCISDWFIGGTKNMNMTIFANVPSYISLYKVSASLNELWRKFIGGDAYYILYNIYSTSDGGCLLAGAAYDWRIQYYERDAILLKVDENGFITSTNQLEHLHTHDAIVYPNPGKEKLVIEIGPQINGARFVLYDMAGKPIMETMLNHTSISLNTSQLSPGLYLWNIIYKGKVIESGKWVKE